MAPLVPRLHLLEINDQSWFPDFLRSRVQASLTLLWTFRIPLLQPYSPASLAALILHKVLGERSSRYIYVDFCSGAGGPTLAIEKDFNARLAASTSASAKSDHNSDHGSEVSSSTEEDAVILTPQSRPTGSSAKLSERSRKQTKAKNVAFVPGSVKPDQAHFVLTDIKPHLLAWGVAASQSPRIRYVPDSVDASAASPSLLSSVAPEALPMSASKLPIFRLFSLAFHHFDDPLAEKILANTMETSAGFAILELQGRNFTSQILCLSLFPLLVLISLFYFWNDPIHMLFTYLLPIVPFVVSLDGIVSSLRTRTGEEVKDMVAKVLREQGQDVDEWDVIWGSEWHTWPIGELSWIVGLKRTDGKS